MSTAVCAFAARALTRDGEALLGERVAALERFYAPAGVPVVRDAGWGTPGADMAGAGFSVEDGRLRTAPSGPVAAYHARGADLEVWASHAVAAAVLARGRAAVDPAAIPELLAFDFVGGDRCLVAGVRPLPPATEVDVVSGEERCWWPQRERWSPVPEDEAHAHAEAALLATLRSRAGDGAGLCLTAGADSRVLAVALHELGIPTTAVTWGEPGWPEVEGARAVAEALELEWRGVASWRDDDAIDARGEAEVRFSDGVLGLGLSDRVWPDAPAVVLGASGEVGRAFYWRPLAGQPPPRDAEGVAGALFAEGRLAGATREAQALAREATLGWARAALESGREGWAALDVLYAEQRVGRWGRGQVPAFRAAFVAGFSPAEVQRGLSSLPLADKLSDGFHRRFVADRRPDLALPEPPAAPPLPPPPARLQRVRRRLRPAPAPALPPTPHGDPLLVALWAERPAIRRHVAQDILGAPLLRDAMGAAWCDAIRDGFLAGDPRMTERAMLAAGPVRLDAALRAA